MNFMFYDYLNNIYVIMQQNISCDVQYTVFVQNTYFCYYNDIVKTRRQYYAHEEKEVGGALS